MKVLMVTNMYPHDGDPSYGCFVKEQIDSIVRHGVDCDVYFINGRKSKLNYLKAIWKIPRILSSNNYDLVHAHYGLSAIPARFQRKFPLVISFCGDDILGSPKENGTLTRWSLLICWISKTLARHCDAVIVKSKEMLKHTPRECRAYVVPNGVDFEMFKPIPKEEARKQLRLKPNTAYLLFPSNPNFPVKRFELAKKAFEIVRQTVSDCELLVISGKRREEVSLCMNASDCLLLTSYHEGSPNIVKEAMACNLPVVSVDVGDVSEVIAKTSRCYIAKPDPDDVSDKLIKVLQEGTRTEGRIHIPHLEINNIAKRIISIYQDL